MNERRHKRKDDTWTQDELSSALRKKDDRRQRKEPSKLTQESPHTSARHKSDRRSAKRDEEEYDTESRRSKRDDKNRHSASDHKRTRDREKERRHREKDDEAEYRKEKERRRKEREARETESNEKRREDRRERRRYEENDVEKREKDRRRKDKDERQQRQRDEGGETRERRHREKREEKKSRTLDADSEQELRRKERKEEKRRLQEEARRHDDRERKRRDKDRSDRQRSDRHRSDEYELAEKHSSRRNEQIKTRKEEVKPVEEEYNYEDEEFEDYEDDFEDEEVEESESQTGEEERAPEVDAVIQAIKQENQRVASARTSSAKSDRSYESDEMQPFSSPQVMATSINFTSAKMSKRRTDQRVLKRRDDLINLIQLDVISFDLFDLPPVTEYAFYIKNFGSQNSRQMATQCNDDALEIETQTDLPDTTEKWTQQPQDGDSVCGGTSNEPEFSRRDNMLSLMQEGSQRLGNFLHYSSNIVDAAFTECTVWSETKAGKRSTLSCCDSCTKFNTSLSYFQGRQILYSVFGEGGMMALSFGMSDHEVATRFDRKGIITVWKPTNTEQPDKILLCDALPITCCFVPGKNNLLFVGADDGSVLVYDLNEPSSMHQCIEIEKNKMTVLRNATYTTGWLSDIHTSPITCINPVGTFQTSNQVFSLEESARICIWTVVEILSDIDDDVGLAPQGHVKLVKSSAIDVNSGKSTSAELGFRTTCAVCPDSSVFYVGTEHGTVLSLTRNRKLKSYRSHGVGGVTSISFSKLNSTLMLVSYSDSSISLFQVKQESPYMSWSLDGPVLFCDWSNCRSSVFFALDSTNHFHVWDLMAMDSAPVVSDIFQQKTLGFSVDRQAKNTTDLMVAYDSCSFEVHRLSPHFTDSVTTDEDQEMMTLLSSFG